jgi:hypothetical protein
VLLLLVVAVGWLLTACANDSDGDASAPVAPAPSSGLGTDVSQAGPEPDAGRAAPLPLSADLCSDPDKMMDLLDAQAAGGLVWSGDLNGDQVERMVAAPTDGPFYLFTLRRYRESAVYADGRATDLTGREAGALYDPGELLDAIGARQVYHTDVDNQIDGDEIVWDTIDIVEYPCPVAFFAMLSDPRHQDLVTHDTAAVENEVAIVADLVPLPPPTDPDQSEAAFPPTADDPAFDLIHVMDFHDIAQYEPDANEPERTGREAWNLYQAGGTGASIDLGIYPTAILEVQGVLSGDDRTFDQILMVHMSSLAGFRALLDDSTRQDGRYHRHAALQNNYSMITYPTLSQIPYYSGH